VPITGPYHEDKDIIGFPQAHWHIDWRFVNARDLPVRFTEKWAEHAGKYLFGKVLSTHGHPDGQQMTEVQSGLRRMKCKRAYPNYPRVAAFWLPQLEAAYKKCQLKASLICPHKGIPLGGLEMRDGIVECPGHGLRWCVSTGKLITDPSRAAAAIPRTVALPAD